MEYKPWRTESIPWRDKAQRLIYSACQASYLQSNTTPANRVYKRHHPYSVPQIAQDLIECLNTNDEIRAKTIFLYDYNAIVLAAL